MALEIIIIKAPGSVTVSEKSHTFVGSGGTIGRGEDNHLVLEDADRFLSSQHCEIICDGDHNFILDLSTNGTFLNGSPEPLGKGVRAALKDGDSFELGDYTLQVKSSDSSSKPSVLPFGNDVSPFDRPDAEAAFTSSSPFGESDDVFGALREPFDPPQDPFPGEGISESDLGLATEDTSADPLAALDFLAEPLQPSFGEPFAEFQQSAPLDDRHGSYADGASALTSAVSWPESSGQNLIPEEWEEELGFSSTSYPAGPAGMPSGSPGPTQETDLSVGSNPQPAIAVRPGLRNECTAAGSASPLPGADSPPISHPHAPNTPQDASTAALQPPAGGVSNTSGPGGASAGLIEAMGLDPQKLSSEQITEINQEVGLLMRQVVGGMMQVLRSRSSIKNEFRMNVTTIQPVENNPLKFSADVDEALDNMFVRRSGAYKKPIDAVREGFQEIGEHQVAMIAGIRHGFEQMMTRFEPTTLESHFDRQGGALPGLKKAKYWSQYNDHYKSFVDNMEHSFQHLFGSDFVHAYEDQLRRLKMARNKNN